MARVSGVFQCPPCEAFWLTSLVVEDGYGLSYAIGDNEIRWCVTTKNNDAEKFGKALVAAAEDVRKMMDNAKKSGPKV
jgi:carnitine O-acetyltransferase